jgi:ferredoxin
MTNATGPRLDPCNCDPACVVPSFCGAAPKTPAWSAGSRIVAATGTGAVGLGVDNACRSGTCGSCRVKLVSGNVRMAVQGALTEEDKPQNYILTCQAQIGSDFAVEA